MRAAAVSLLLAIVACSKLPSSFDGRPSPAPPQPPPVAANACDGSRAMTLHFYDVGQALAVLIALPDGRHVLVDAGDSPVREGCGEPCARAHAHLLAKLHEDLRGAPIDLLWITHQHSDHIGGVPDVAGAFAIGAYVDNGRDARKSEVRRAREAAAARGAVVRVVDPEHLEAPLPPSPGVKLTAVVPPAWPSSCREDANECSIALRIDDCASSVLLTGDAEHEEEKLLDPGGPVTLLQVGHHGSETSTSPAFLSRTRPSYAVISAGRPGEGMDREYCHPRAIVVERLTRVLGGAGGATIRAFDGTRCDRATDADWIAVPSSDRLWATERDGDVVVETRGDGVFRRVR